MRNKWNEIYPRPQLIRDNWTGLNGEWRFRTVSAGSRAEAAEKWERIIVPFCPESRLSGICRRIAAGEKMIYERDFTVPEGSDDKRVILHFGAVDQIAEVFIDGVKAGSHAGGYLPFSIDITDFVISGDPEGEKLLPVSEAAAQECEGAAQECEEVAQECEEEQHDDTSDTESGAESDAAYDESNGESEEKSDDSMPELDWAGRVYDTCKVHTLRVEAIDNLDHKYPWGKQKRKNGGMWYTPVSGIWQSVWMESVPEEYIESLKIDCGADWVEIRAYGVEEGIVSLLGEQIRMAPSGSEGMKCAAVHININHPHMWTPDDPYLYSFAIDTPSGDHIQSYFALRTLTIEEHSGYKRLCLNGRPYFFNGLLDQGYWQDGIYTPESPDKFAGDILAMKSLGYNTLRKHIKVEAEQYYYDCDRLGMVVFQDMVNNSNYSFLRDSALPTIGMLHRSDAGLHRGEAREIFLKSMDETVRHLYNHPSICYWTIFNEGWGQFNADAAYDRLRALDSSRFIDSTSGWYHQSKTDVDSYHVYFKPVQLTAGDRPLVLSEFGGYACKIPNHCYNKEKTYGYRKCANEAALLGDMRHLYETEILPMTDKGLCAAIYTQLSDVEDETNGILTYDREILKFRSYTGTGRIVILGSYIDHQGGKAIVAPTQHKIRAYVAENHSDVIRILSEESDPVEVSITDRSNYEQGTQASLVTGLLEGFADLFGVFDGSGNGFDVHIRSEINDGSGLGALAAFEILVARIINDRYFAGKADAVQLAKIATFAENEFYGKPCGMADRLAVSLGRPALVDFYDKEPEIEFLDYDFSKLGYETDAEITGSDYAAVTQDMSAVAEALGVSRLADINEEQFRRSLPLLLKKVQKGDLSQLMIDRAQYFFDENESVLAASIALKTGNIERFLDCLKK